MHIHDRALFDWHQTPNLDSNDSKFHCDSPLGYDFKQYTVAMRPSVLSAILLEGTLMANQLFSSPQYLVFHLHSKGVCIKMHRQQSWHVIGQVCVWAFCSGERDFLGFFVFGSNFFNSWPLWLGARDLRCLFCAAEWFLSNSSLSSGERDFRFLLCASASVYKIVIFFSGGRDSRCVLCASALLHKIWVFFSGESDRQ